MPFCDDKTKKDENRGRGWGWQAFERKEMFITPFIYNSTQPQLVLTTLVYQILLVVSSRYSKMLSFIQKNIHSNISIGQSTMSYATVASESLCGCCLTCWAGRRRGCWRARTWRGWRTSHRRAALDSAPPTGRVAGTRCPAETAEGCRTGRS